MTQSSLSGRLFLEAFCDQSTYESGNMGFENDALTSIRSGNQKAFSELYDNSIQALRFYAFRIVKRTDVAEDLAQETFARIWEKRSTFSNIQHLRRFMFTATRNAGISWLRTQNTQKTTMETFAHLSDIFETEPDWEQIHTEAIGHLYQVMEDLPLSDSKIIRLSLLQGKSHEHIAHQLELTTSSVAVKKFRAIKLMRSLLRSSGFIPT